MAMWSQWWELAAFGLQAPFLGGILENGAGKRFRLNDTVLLFDLSESNFRYENICRVILFSITWNTGEAGIIVLIFHLRKVNA